LSLSATDQSQSTHHWTFSTFSKLVEEERMVLEQFSLQSREENYCEWRVDVGGVTLADTQLRTFAGAAPDSDVGSEALEYCAL
jgi:hypothetical protein